MRIGVWKNVVMSSLFFLAIVFVVNEVSFKEEKDEHKISSFFEIDSNDVTSMKVTYNRKTIIEANQSVINSFVNLTKKCSSPLRLRKMRVIDRYEVELKVKGDDKVFHFFKKNNAPFMMVVKSNGKYERIMRAYNCRAMESFMSKYK